MLCLQHQHACMLRLFVWVGDRHAQGLAVWHDAEQNRLAAGINDFRCINTILYKYGYYNTIDIINNMKTTKIVYPL